MTREKAGTPVRETTYTVKQLSDLAGVSVRTLHYYDEIGLLKPSCYGDNGYRYYGEEAALRLQQILFYRELGLSLNDIMETMDQPDFDVLRALESHRHALREQAARLNELIHTVDKTILHLKGRMTMSTKELFTGFTEEQQKAYEEEAAQRWDPKTVAESNRRWRSYSKEQKEKIGLEAIAIYDDLLAHMHEGYDSAEAQQAIGRWHQHIRYFYEPTVDILRGLGQGYAEDPQFAAFYRKMHPDMPEFLRQAITHYCEGLSKD